MAIADKLEIIRSFSFIRSGQDPNYVNDRGRKYFKMSRCKPWAYTCKYILEEISLKEFTY